MLKESLAAGAASHLLKRGYAANEFTRNDADGPFTWEMPIWGMILLCSTLVVFCTLDFIVDYSCQQVATTLLMIESPETILIEPVNLDEDPDAKAYSDEKSDPDQPLLEQPVLLKKPLITSTFRSTLRHLRAKSGRLAIFRGLPIFLIGRFAVEVPTSMVMNMTSGGMYTKLITRLFSTVLIGTPFYLAWAHTVMSSSSSKRFPSKIAIKKAILPTAHFAMAVELAFLLPFLLLRSYDLHRLDADVHNMTRCEIKVLVTKFASVAVLGLFMVFFVVIPAKVMLTRVQASLLPGNEETIVPFDRTFGGEVVPDLVSGQGVIAMVDAWKTFDSSSRKRLLKAYAKIFFMKVGLGLMFISVAIMEATAILGKDGMLKFFPREQGQAGL